MGEISKTQFGSSKQVRLTNAQILTLFSVPITLVQPRVGVQFLPVSLVIMSNTAAAAYATAAHITLGVTGTLTKWANVTLTNSGLDSTHPKETSYQGIINTTPILSSGLDNLGLILSANADPTGGDPANFAIVQVHYLTIPVV